MAKQRNVPAEQASNTSPLPELEPRHIEWLFSAAQQHFVERIERLELNNMRHRAYAEVPYYEQTVAGRRDRAEKIERNEVYLQQYGRIVEFCIEVRKRVMEHSSQEFAKEVMAEIKRRKV